MAEFAWVARDGAGAVQKGIMIAEDKAAVERRLRAQQLNPQKVSKRLSFSFGSAVEEISGQLEAESDKLGDLRRAIVVEKERLERLRGTVVARTGDVCTIDATRFDESAIG